MTSPWTLRSSCAVTIDGAAFRDVNAAGLYILVNDGTAWFCLRTA